MKIGINGDCVGLTDARKNVKTIVENGFEATFIMAEDERLDEFCQAAKEYDLTVETLHGPFLSDGACSINDVWLPGERGDRMLDRMMKSAEKCAKYDIPYLVTHLSSGNDAPFVNECGLERFGALVKRAKELGVVIAFENLRKTGNFACALEYFPDSGFCLDVGHQYCYAGGRQFLSFFGDRLVTTHIHDNMCAVGQDLHLIPFDGKIDYTLLAKQLRDLNYDGTLMLEVFRGFGKEIAEKLYSQLTDEQYITRAAIAAKKLKKLVEESAE